MSLSDQYPYEKQYKTIYGTKMAYMEHGEGDPIIFQHGNPTSSYIWRNIMPYMEGKGRLIAADLLGMGDSGKLADSGPHRYGYADQRDHLAALFEELGVTENVTLVIQDWGAALCFDWARRQADILKGIAFMEALVAPFPSWDVFPPDFREAVQAFRSEAGEELVLKQNIFIEKVLPTGVLRELSDTEMAEYRRPYLEDGESRRPCLSLNRDVPIAGEPADTWEMSAAYSEWLSHSDVPKLFINADPGSLVDDETREFIRSWPALTEVTVSGHHFVQEDSPHEIGKAIADWHAKLG